MTDKTTKKPIGHRLIFTILQYIIPCGIGLIVGYYLYWNVINPIGKKPAEDKSDWVWVDIEDALPPGARLLNPSEITQIRVPPDVDPRSYFESLPGPEEEPEEEVDPAEAERLANWKANFPYKPTTDPDVVVTEAMLKEGYGYTPIFRNHGYMRHFFENETRFTAQFEQLYRILEEHGRADNPMATANIFEDLRLYQKTDKKHQMDETGCTTT